MHLHSMGGCEHRLVLLCEEVVRMEANQDNQSLIIHTQEHKIVDADKRCALDPSSLSRSQAATSAYAYLAYRVESRLSQWLGHMISRSIMRVLGWASTCFEASRALQLSSCHLATFRHPAVHTAEYSRPRPVLRSLGQRIVCWPRCPSLGK